MSNGFISSSKVEEVVPRHGEEHYQGKTSPDFNPAHGARSDFFSKINIIRPVSLPSPTKTDRFRRHI
jgi:hypothetical protein